MNGSLLEIIDIAHAETDYSIYIMVSFKTMAKPTTIQTLKIAKTADSQWHMISRFMHRSGAKSYYDFSLSGDREKIELTINNSGYDQILLDEYLRTTKEILSHPEISSTIKINSSV